MDEVAGPFEEEGYILEELLWTDSWGEVYHARYVPHAREVALRRFPQGMGSHDAAWELACAEIQAWARLDHPGIARVLDWGRTASESYLVTAVPRGIPLGKVLADDRGAEGAESIFQNLLRSVEAARQWGVLHLGLSPGNIWVGEEGGVEVAEFGLWYVATEFPDVFPAGERLLAPEQLRGERVSAGTDVYALGLLLLALRFGTGRAEAARRGSALPEELGESRRVIARCLDDRPLARYRSAGELAEALGLSTTGWEHEDYRDCPLCRLKSELAKDVGNVAAGRRESGWGLPVSAYPWIAIIALGVAALLVWWLALR